MLNAVVMEVVVTMVVVERITEQDMDLIIMDMQCVPILEYQPALSDMEVMATTVTETIVDMVDTGINGDVGNF